MTSPLELSGYVHIYSGKVRDLYAPLDDSGAPRSDQVLLVTSDRISAYDCILRSQIPDKGKVLTQLSLWWFEQLSSLVPNHVISTDVPPEVVGRGVLVERLDMVPIECVARAYLTGGGLSQYRVDGTVSGVVLPPGLVDASRLDEPIFTPSTKAPVGKHDQTMLYADVVIEVGASRAEQIRDLTIQILTRGNEIAVPRGILIADTKIEFGVRSSGELVLADEVLTSDSSRFWPVVAWEPGRSQASYDKQFIRDWLNTAASRWDRNSEEELPASIIEQMRAKYVEAYEVLTGHSF